MCQVTNSTLGLGLTPPSPTRGRAFYWSHSFAIATSMLYGLVAVFAVPSILSVLEGSQRSSSMYTAYKRYLSTLLHTTSWFETELKPGSK